MKEPCQPAKQLLKVSTQIVIGPKKKEKDPGIVIKADQPSKP